MSKYIRVTCETPCDDLVTFHKVPDGFTKRDMEEVGEAIFFDWAGYGVSEVDQEEIPSDAEILDEHC